jgi:hypothetical protein
LTSISVLKGGRKVKKKAVTGIMLTLLLICLLTLTSNVGLVKAEYSNFTITVTPESPSVCDEVNLTVSFATPSISYEVVFSPLSQVDNNFFANVDIKIPEIVILIIGGATQTYQLGKLPDDSYSFNVNVQVWDAYGGLLAEAWHSKSFNVSGSVTGDVNGDGIVDIVDGVIIGVAFGSKSGDLKWNPIADIAPEGAPDDFIDIQDIALWAIHFGEDC